ncbi:MAG: hypothetical protein K2Y05_06470 [Hyphomicrobiaceae bacterium]|nr:hypothetical protein [Hyphomicrobiaceae bacterium]
MARKKTAPRIDALPNGEFYLLWDERQEPDFLRDWQANDQNPELSDKIHSESLRRSTELNPKFKRGLFENHAFDCPAYLVLPSARIRSEKPGSGPHFDRVKNYSEPTYSGYFPYTVVSIEWKTAIEAFEPSVHEFYPFRLEFNEEATVEAFVMRDRTPILQGCFKGHLCRLGAENMRDIRSYPESSAFYCHALPQTENRTTIMKGDLVWSTFGRNVLPPISPVDASAFGSRHWVHFEQAIGVSRPLAERLLPLLPSKITPVPLPLMPGTYLV